METDPNDTSAPRLAERRPVDENANLITHALGFVLSVPASALLMRLVVYDQQAINIAACGICGTLAASVAADAVGLGGNSVWVQELSIIARLQLECGGGRQSTQRRCVVLMPPG